MKATKADARHLSDITGDPWVAIHGGLSHTPVRDEYGESRVPPYPRVHRDRFGWFVKLTEGGPCVYTLGALSSAWSMALRTEGIFRASHEQQMFNQLHALSRENDELRAEVRELRARLVGQCSAEVAP